MNANALPLACSLALCASFASVAAADGGGDFWGAWGDGRAEVSSYRLVQPRYGQLREGTAVLIYVTEPFSDTLRVKADPGKHEERDVYPVLKLNFVRKFQTGVYDYSVLTSVFARIDSPTGERPFAARKISLSSQEWCGHVYHQILPRGGKLLSQSHSYFDGEADEVRDLEAPAGGLSEDELPIVLRTYPGKPDLVAPGATRTFPFLPSLLRARLLHERLAWGRVRISAAAATDSVTVPAGRFTVRGHKVVVEGGGGRSGLYQIEVAPPRRLIAWRFSDGEEGSLVASERLKYWEQNGRDGEQRLPPLGLRPVTAPRR